MPLQPVYREALPVLFLAGAGLAVAGLVLEQMEELLRRIPGLLVMVPALIALRGGISAAMGARMGSAIHMGLMGKGNLWNPEAWQATIAAILLSALFSAAAGVLAHFTTLLLGLESAGLLVLTLIATVAGTVAGVFLVGVTFGIVVVATWRDIDPDNVTTPALATVGDIITVVILFAVAAALGGGP